MRKTIAVTLKKEHWDAGLKNAFRNPGELDGMLLIFDYQCPLALALREKLGVLVKINGDHAVIDRIHHYNIDKAGSDFVAMFDDHEEEFVPEFPIKVKLTLVEVA